VDRIPVADVFAANQVNAVVFRCSALASWAGVQYTAFYDPQGEIVLGRRGRQEKAWTFEPLGYRGAMRDAHNAISLGVGPDGRLHISYDHHGDHLHYRMGVAPGETRFLPEAPMTGVREGRVTYPQFVNGPAGQFYFFYRDGGSGNGDLCMHVLNPAGGGRWRALPQAVVSGEGRSNPYWWRPAVGRWRCRIWRPTRRTFYEPIREQRSPHHVLRQ